MLALTTTVVLIVAQSEPLKTSEYSSSVVLIVAHA